MANIFSFQARQGYIPQYLSDKGLYGTVILNPAWRSVRDKSLEITVTASTIDLFSLENCSILSELY